jgi:hypothetical protein
MMPPEVDSVVDSAPAPGVVSFCADVEVLRSSVPEPIMIPSSPFVVPSAGSAVGSDAAVPEPIMIPPSCLAALFAGAAAVGSSGPAALQAARDATRAVRRAVRRIGAILREGNEVMEGPRCDGFASTCNTLSA